MLLSYDHSSFAFCSVVMQNFSVRTDQILSSTATFASSYSDDCDSMYNPNFPSVTALNDVDTVVHIHVH